MRRMPFRFPRPSSQLLKAKSRGLGLCSRACLAYFRYSSRMAAQAVLSPAPGQQIRSSSRVRGMGFVSGNTVSVWADRRIRFLAAVSCGPKKISRFLAVSTKKGILYSCSRSPINAILPSSWPEGAGMRQRASKRSGSSCFRIVSVKILSGTRKLQSACFFIRDPSSLLFSSFYLFCERMTSL